VDIEIFDEFVGLGVVVFVLGEFESAVVGGPHVAGQQFHQVLLQDAQLEVSATLVVRVDRDAVLQLERVGIGGIVHQHHIV
jgi:hypothetical protein